MLKQKEEHGAQRQIAYCNICAIRAARAAGGQGASEMKKIAAWDLMVYVYGIPSFFMHMCVHIPILSSCVSLSVSTLHYV